MKFLWILVLVVLTTACAGRSTKPLISPIKQVINCQQPATDPVPPPPVDSQEQWLKFGPGWAVAAMELLFKEREYRKLEQICYKVQNEY